MSFATSTKKPIPVDARFEEPPSIVCEQVFFVGDAALEALAITLGFVVITLHALQSKIYKTNQTSDCFILANEETEKSLSLISQLRKAHFTNPIIAIVNDPQQAAQAIKAGANDYCYQEFCHSDLKLRVEICLKNFAQAQELTSKISEQSRQVELSHLLTEKIVDALPVSLYVVDRELKIVAWNRNREIGGQGIEKREVIGRGALEVFSKMSRKRLEDEFKQVLTTGKLLKFEQESQVNKQKRHWLISKIPMKIDECEDEISHVITLGEEITEEKRMNEAIINAEKLTGIGRLASGVVHEINNPLATIAACTEALQNRLLEISNLPSAIQADFKEYLKLIEDETFRCKGITNSLLEFSRHRESQKTTEDLNRLIEQTLRLVKHHPKLKRLNFVIELEKDLPQINANEGQIIQVFIAIISNACDAVSEESGQLTLRSKLCDADGTQYAAAEFSDNGAGIPPEILTKIFEPFVTTKPFGQGTGLGLAVCYGIISDHGGRIEVTSQPGHGTTMNVLLPITEHPPTH